MSGQIHVFPQGSPRGDEALAGHQNKSSNLQAFITAINKKIRNFFYFSRRRHKKQGISTQTDKIDDVSEKEVPHQTQPRSTTDDRLAEKEAMIHFQRLQLNELATKMEAERKLFTINTTTKNKKRKLDENVHMRTPTQTKNRSKLKTMQKGEPSSGNSGTFIFSQSYTKVPEQNDLLQQRIKNLEEEVSRQNKKYEILNEMFTRTKSELNIKTSLIEIREGLDEKLKKEKEQEHAQKLQEQAQKEISLVARQDLMKKLSSNLGIGAAYQKFDEMNLISPSTLTTVKISIEGDYGKLRNKFLSSWFGQNIKPANLKKLEMLDDEGKVWRLFLLQPLKKIEKSYQKEGVVISFEVE